MKDKIFIDTNIFVYTQSSIDVNKRDISINIIKNCNCYTSTQVLNEVSNVMFKKLNMQASEIKQIITAINENCRISIISYDMVQMTLDIKERYGYSYYDSLILVSALKSGCQKLFSEDMSDGQIIESTLKIINPFNEA